MAILSAPPVNSALINPSLSVPATELTHIGGVEYRHSTRVWGITDAYIQETLLPLSFSGQSVRLNLVGERAVGISGFRQA